MPRYKVTHRLGCYIAGLGSRPFGGEFEVSDDTAARLRLDESPNLERMDGRARKSTPKPAQVEPDDTQER